MKFDVATTIDENN